jgi:prepilin-type N-terminal cleavage/methylation domain-containing protein
MQTTRHRGKEQHGFTLIETLFAVAIMAGAFLAFASAIPLAALIHRGALEREQALSLAQVQMEYFLTNPGPYPGDRGTQANFQNAAQFPAGFTGSYTASSFGSGLTLIVVDVKPSHASKVEISAIDTTFSNLSGGN